MTRPRSGVVAVFAALALVPFACAQSQPTSAPSGDEVLSSVQRGVAFLLKDQNADGSWGGARAAIYTFTGDVWSNPDTHRSWRVATTGLACLALLHSSETDASQRAIRRGVDYVMNNFDVGRPNEWDTMNCWAYIYALQVFAETIREKDLIAPDAQAKIREAVPRLMLRLRQSQSLSGGWGYLEFDAPRTAQPQWATSFTTAAGVVALVEAKRSNLPIDEDVLSRARRAVERCQMRSGAYTYSVQPINDPRSSEWIDQIKGSLSRIQSCNVAILLGGGEMPVERLRTGIRQFFEYHRFLDIARNRPIPHETYYYNSGYFYLFGHYYAARVIEALPEAERPDLWSRLQREIIKTQQQDGSMWDYDMHAYHKPYGTAYALLALSISVKP